ncbi:MAG TPA: porin family protein [Saprospiraceae bacterium]|nr:porin family protein [Saprospiraceae bacterium]
MDFQNVKLIKKIGLIAAVLMHGSLFAQQGEFRLGFQVNPGIAWMTTNDLGISNVGTNLTVGIAAQGELGISDQLAIATGMGLTFNRGGKLRHETGGNFFPQSRLSNDAYNSGPKPLPDGTKLKYSLQYLEFPFALKWRPPENGLMRYYVEAPVLTWCFTLQRRGAIKAGDINTEKEDISKDVNPFNISLGIGGGLEYAMGQKTSLVAGLSFHRGLLDITSDNATTATPNPDDNPFDPNDDYILHKEDAHAALNTIVVRIGILF